MRVRGIYGVVVLAALAWTGASAGAGNEASGTAVTDAVEGASCPELLPCPSGLRPQIEFWKQVFATYSRFQVVIHDTEHLDKIYKVLDFRPYLAEGMDEGEVARIKSNMTKQELGRIRAMLLKLDRLGEQALKEQGGSLTSEERRIVDMYRDVYGLHKFRDAADEDRLRSQAGLKERFAEGIRAAHAYFQEMETIFRREEVPAELTRLPLIESTFNLDAYSKVGAAGVWQFMRSTGRLYLRIDGAVDERRDPLLAALAAARLLKDNYEMLGTWPLAITAYNHGPFGVYKATEELGTRDIVQIVRHYHGRTFGFAGRNFYAELLAALEVERDYQKYFGPLRLDPPLHYDSVRLTDFVPLKSLARCAKTDVDDLVELNPAILDPVRKGRLHVPRGYRLRLPAGTLASFEDRYETLASNEKASGQPRLFAMHRVKRGQSLAAIARQYGTTVSTIKRLNGLRKVKHLQTGRSLRVPA